MIILNFNILFMKTHLFPLEKIVISVIEKVRKIPKAISIWLKIYNWFHMYPYCIILRKSWT